TVALDVSASRFMDRVVRGRVWIAVIAVSLFGLVAMQVSLLKLNTGIGRAVQTVSTLDRSNSALRSDITRLSAAERIQPLAEAQGLVMPAPADVAYLRAGNRHDDAVRAARRMRSPDPANAGLAGSTPAIGLEAAVITTTTMAGTTATVPKATAPVPGTTAPGTTGTTGGSAPATGAAPNSATSAPAAPAATSTGAAPAATGAAPAATGAAPAATAPPATATATADPGSGGATPQATPTTP
ncbi:MAG: hypothetical protein QOE31_2468, partial [Solirubrobacteraceae bacterium]|nr:hypothetical protein [Solirubrobacteraceae bacterium]